MRQARAPSRQMALPTYHIPFCQPARANQSSIFKEKNSAAQNICTTNTTASAISISAVAPLVVRWRPPIITESYASLALETLSNPPCSIRPTPRVTGRRPRNVYYIGQVAAGGRINVSSMVCAARVFVVKRTHTHRSIYVWSYLDTSTELYDASSNMPNEFAATTTHMPCVVDAIARSVYFVFMRPRSDDRRTYIRAAYPYLGQLDSHMVAMTTHATKLTYLLCQREIWIHTKRGSFIYILGNIGISKLSNFLSKVAL